VQRLAGGILRPELCADLLSLSIDPESIYDVYEVHSKLEVLLIDVEHALDALADLRRLSRAEIEQLIEDWIGLEGGYLGLPLERRFTYTSHDRFWKRCGVDVDTNSFDGSTRACFEAHLSVATAPQQATVLHEILERFPRSDLKSGAAKNLRTPSLESNIKGWISRLQKSPAAMPTAPSGAGAEVKAALKEAQTLGAVRGIDRVHTAMHAYLHQLCAEARLEQTTDQ
jgi:hypothetical protein